MAHYLSTREVWQDRASEYGKSHEINVVNILQEYVKEVYNKKYIIFSTNRRADGKIIDFMRQIFLWGEHNIEPYSTTKPSNPKIKDIFLDKKENVFYEYTGKRWRFKQSGLQPDTKIINRETQKPFFLECKTQEDRGNAHERVYKYFAPGLQKLVIEKFGYNPFGFIVRGEILNNPQRIRELKVMFEPVKERFVMLKDNIQIIDMFENTIKGFID